MPRTEAGKSLYADADAYGGEVYYESMAEWARRIAAIEAEARDHQNNEDFRVWKQRICAAERARIRAEVEGLRNEKPDWCLSLDWATALDAVLRIIDGEDDRG